MATTLYHYQGQGIFAPVNGGFPRRLGVDPTPTPGNWPPGAPTGLTVISPTPTSIEASWNAAVDPDGTITGYQVRLNGVLRATVTGLTYAIDNLNPTTDYVVAVRAVDNAGSVGNDALASITTKTPPPATGIEHGSDLTDAHVGPWSLQNVARGSETLDVVPAPSRGYWRYDDPAEFAPTGTYVYNNNTSNKGGIVPAGGMEIDGFNIPAGTRVIQFRDLSATDFYIRGTQGTWLFRGCRFRNDNVGGSSTFNDSTADYTQYVHYCDFGGTHPDTQSGSFWKAISGRGHRMFRTLVSDSWTGLQPNAPDFEVIECIIRDIHFVYGEMGTSGTGPDATTSHMNGLSVEGLARNLSIIRCQILIPSPDNVPALIGGTAPGQVGYGTQPGQLGYGNGSKPGRLVAQTDCIAIFAILGNNENILIEGCLLGGTGYCLYAGNADGNARNIHLIENAITTRWWTNGGYYGPITDVPQFGVNGNISQGNVWFDDYGAGGNGCTALADRQYPNGDGPRKGQTVF